MSEPPYILYIPEIALEKVFSFLSYDEIAKNRLVCQTFNEIGGRLLSRGFIQVDKRHNLIFKRVKSMLPRRESERRMHPLSRHCDILQGVETRISMLNMTYMKYIESNLLCFIPGKVLDEIIKVLDLLDSDNTPPRTHQLLQELRDLSSMAMEHFDEHILPGVKEHRDQVEQRRHKMMPMQASTATSTNRMREIIQIEKIKKQYKVYKHQVDFLSQHTLKLTQKLKKQNVHLNAQSIKIREQERKIQEQSVKINEQETAIADIKKHLDGWDLKYKTLTAEMIRTRDDILLKATCSTPRPVSQVLQRPKSLPLSVRPRVDGVWRKNLINLDLQRKRKNSLLPEIPVKMTKIEDEKRQGYKFDYGMKPKLKDTGDPKVDVKSNLKMLINSLIQKPLINIQNRKRKLTEDIDLKDLQ